MRTAHALHHPVSVQTYPWLSSPLLRLFIEGSLEVKLPTICRDGKAEVREEKSRSETIRDGESQKREDAGARKGRKVAIHSVFPMNWGSGGSKSNLAKAAGAEPAGQMSDEQIHAVVARSTFPSQNVQNTSRTDPFWKLRCWKSARCCGAKHTSKSKCTKHAILGPLWEVAMSKKCTPLWREAHFQVKTAKNWGVRTTFGSWDVEKVQAVVAQSTFPSQNVQSTPFSDHFWKLRCRKSVRRCQVKTVKNWGLRTTFGSWDVEKVHAVVARSTFPSQKCKKLRGLGHFLTFSCRKSACCCGAKHIAKWKV